MLVVSINAKMMPSIVVLMAMVITANAQDDNLLIGKLISQGTNRGEVLGAARSAGIVNQVESVKGKEVAESARQNIEGGEELKVGNLVQEFDHNPVDQEVRTAVGSLRYVERKKGKVLDFESGKYVPNPVKVLAEIKAKGGDIETVEGEIVAGDAADVDVVSMRGDDDFRKPAVRIPVPAPKPSPKSAERCCKMNKVHPSCIGLCLEEGAFSSRNAVTIGLGACARFQTVIAKCVKQVPLPVGKLEAKQCECASCGCNCGFDCYRK